MIPLVKAFSQEGRIQRYRLGGEPQQATITVTDHSLVIDYSLSELDIRNLVTENGTFYRLHIPGHTPTSSPGKPELPVLSRMLTMPESSEYAIRISDIKTRKIRPGWDRIEGILFPSQEGETKEPQKTKPGFVLDKAVYSSR
ncbi:MAG: hypothetical protein IQL11_09715, partial [Bacteroidales bacterium]|nr:hypothetical protein [Bacteroidales bacterium]